MGEQGFDYYYGDESGQFSSYRIPRQLITGARFKRLSTDAKLLYGLLLDRMGLSAKMCIRDRCATWLGETGGAPLPAGRVQRRSGGRSGIAAGCPAGHAF